MRIAYLVPTYPAVSHAAIAREVSGLRRLGVDVQTFSVRRPSEDQLLTDEDRLAAAHTPTIQPPDPRVVLSSHVRALASSPRRYIETLLLALRMSPGGIRARTWHFFYFAEAIVLWNWLRQRDIRHVHVHFAFAATTIAMLYAYYGERAGSTWSFTMHGPTEFDNVERYVLAEKVQRARFVVCISDYARSQLMKLTAPEDWGKLKVIHCGIDPTIFRADAQPDGRHTDRVTVLTLGRLVPDKGQALLIGALALLPPMTLQRIRLVIAGGGPERTKLQRDAAELRGAEVVFTGPVGQDQLVTLYARADIFCLPSLAEGVPSVLMEAMAMGLPVITTRIMGIPELVRDRVSGLLVSPGRIDELAGAIVDLLDDDDLRRSLGEAGRERVLMDYDIRRSVAALRDLYHSELAGQPSANADEASSSPAAHVASS